MALVDCTAGIVASIIALLAVSSVSSSAAFNGVSTDPNCDAYAGRLAFFNCDCK